MKSKQTAVRGSTGSSRPLVTGFYRTPAIVKYSDQSLVLKSDYQSYEGFTSV